ncbi:multifunctional oxoglutarate decarboxylase/oxoglutarate dehydrogenase thiamine pyrophosphate-binding subunit/dihydrolipoyllysine-residue succinyltransferase subunit [Actinoallomurus spadix]|uniref:Multifunctional oxoglutarate decarboxylase/oxoglutarate dehydrogenase thiamine pyrophosphate-binding subunit/dihydrolipoyllysine-residue succinyltransferase subunit n=1 Tax=Actinoallomurus spadix TaxID=79912 RepID=A0ABP3FZP5_9ACTN|nr:multifunctional oxoglutarate decarboxylase/oxoglutarate dehydrogenase thiamine pyrophosphate-binding subunit/dihydrolipoyllysine-residue succinyltransferase subunit [Actinoallomurus spadix]MCO5990675.1 multifunctional oxoglutarate decarboxylase/oxoglutarate dehydrogenase thiamine pyrophosphate-binding subunit/dihydrolipoyllysine-residue succinyltransferase subunit [Actinoallomurus spadix]
MSTQSSRSSADLNTPDFGPNEWLVDELYQKYLEDPNSVDRAWWNFFADYQPDRPAKAPAGADGAAAPPTTPPTAPTPKQTPAAPAAAAPAKPAEAAPAKKPAPAPQVPGGAEEVRLRGVAARTVTNMEASLAVPTATSVRAVPAKLLIDNRIVVNNHLKRGRGGKVSFTHLIGYAIVRALQAMPEMNASYAEVDGKPTLIRPEHVNFGLAIDLKKDDGQRQLVVPNIKAAETLDFRQFWAAYEELVRKARANKLTIDDYAGTTISLTNPGTIGTVHSVPRLMPGQGSIIGVGAMEYPAEYAGTSEEALARLGISKVMTLTSTYDHRIIQGAQSGDFLRMVHRLLLGEDEFYDEIFEALRIPYEPVRWVQDISATHEDDVAKVARVHELIHAYRVRGHLMADTDPLEYTQRRHPDLDVLKHGLTLWDLEREFATGGFGGKPTMKLRDILGVLRNSYCRTVGIEYMHIQDPGERAWIQSKVEVPHDKPDREEQLHILGRLNTAEAFETFLQTKFVGQKRFSLEGGESLIPLLDSVITAAAQDHLDEVVIGMAHRGRLNVLANIVGKSYGQIFGEFEGNLDPRSAQGSGDVKYHLGAEGDFVARDGSKIRTSLVANPSHLETVDPVAEGVVRAKQDLRDVGEGGFTVMPILIHGDAAFAGQGVVAETLNLSQLRGYRTGGTVHIIVNNQVGFTTAPEYSRSSVYATDVARMIQAPIFHVNGDDPEQCARVARLAFEYRQAFNKDVVIDMICYRRRGHNESDNPSFTQPLMYDLIDAKRSVRKLYTEALIGRGDITVEEAEQALRDYQQQLERAFSETREATKQQPPAGFTKPDVERIPLDHVGVATAVSDETIKRIIDTQLNLPEGFTPHPRVQPLLAKRAQMVEEDAIDWATGEMFAFGSLLIDGRPVRLVGQDSRRGTFGQRHAVLFDRKTGEEHTPLKQFGKGTSKFYVHDSLLSEYAAMGFEYGYSMTRPDALVCWEAQFGDFANGAQTILDEYISSGEQKWGQRSSVVLLLPHGYEGQGPDHSSARIERYLQLCAEDNMTVAQPSTPANYFHLLRWQALSPREKPLIVFTPKSMLRLKAATSATADFTSGSFQPVIPDSKQLGQVRRVVLTSGKLYYDLAAAREKSGDTSVALVRVERLYPLPWEEIKAELAKYPADAELVWAQDEPANMGAWPFMALKLPPLLEGRELKRVSRRASSSPAVGSAKMHALEQQGLVAAVFSE